MRLKIIRVVIAGLFLIVTLDLFYVQVIRGRYYFNLSRNNRIRVIPLEGWRGRIRDRNGKILVDNRLAYNLMITPQEIQDQEALFRFLSGVLNADREQIIRIYRKKKSAPFTPVAVAEDIPLAQAILIEENKYRFPSMFIQESFKRAYPLENNSAHVLGYVGKISRAQKERFQEYGYSPQSMIGYSGVEEYYDAYLRGEEGGLQVEVDSLGRQVRLLSLKEPTKGQDITLTVDSTLQEMALGLLEGKRGAIVVMDMNNGEILGMTSSPAFAPSFFVERVYQEQISRLFSDPAAPLMNRAIHGAFPPGSVFKVSLAVGALDTKKVAPEMIFNCQGFYALKNARFRCVHVHGAQNFIEAIAHSCNVYFYNVGLILGPETMSRYARIFGLGEPTHIDLPYEEAGLVPSPRHRLLARGTRWYSGDTLNFAIGQGDISATPLQLVRMMATVARDGVEVQPHVIKTIGHLPFNEYFFLRSIKIEKSIFQTVKKGLRAAVTDFSGTAHVLDLKDIEVAGKTGTAQTSASGDKKSHAWFVGYAKGEKKHVAVGIFLEHGGSSYNATLIARELLLGMQRENIL